MIDPYDNGTGEYPLVRPFEVSQSPELRAQAIAVYEAVDTMGKHGYAFLEVEYHGSIEDCHGRWRLTGGCPCQPCGEMEEDLFDMEYYSLAPRKRGRPLMSPVFGARYRLVRDEDELTCVRPQSIRLL